MAERWYRLTQLPDLTLNKYASLDGRGVDGVLEKHIAFLRQLNRKGIVSGLSYHLYYLYLAPEDKTKDNPGHRLQIFLMIRGNEDNLQNISALIKASPLSRFYTFESKIKRDGGEETTCSIRDVLALKEIEYPLFSTCAFLTKTETFLPAESGGEEEYYMLREWEMNEDGRLYNMCNMMEAIDQTALYRVDLYPVENSVSLRDALRKPMGILRKRQDDRAGNSRRDYDGKDVLKSYEDLIEKFDSSPHFIVNVLVMANGKENAVSILDAAGSESLMKGKYNITTFSSDFDAGSFLEGDLPQMENIRERMIVRKGRPGLIICREDAASINLNYLPTLFSLEEVAPFFRLPALYDGEVIQMAKETAPAAVDKKGSLFLGKDSNGYDVYFSLSLLPKHAFVAGVPGSGKTNTMHHITSSLWKDHGIPFLVLEPAKQEYRALANDPGMKDMYLFSPNADMSFPLHINPFEMPADTLVAEHIRRLCSVFEGAFPLEPPMPFLLDTAIEAVYRELGWIPEHVYTGDEKQENGEKRPLPTMSMLYRRLEQELKSTQYSDEVRGNLESALKVRIGSLLRREMGDIFDVPESTLPPEKWLEVPAVIELESMGTGPANFLTLMLCSLIRETLKVDPKRERKAIKCVAKDGVFSIKIRKNDCFRGEECFIVNEADIVNIKDKKTVVAVSNSGGTALLFEADMSVKLICRDSEANGFFSLDKDQQTIYIIWGNKDIRHVIFIEEAHNLIGSESEKKSGVDADPKQAATSFIVKMLAEVRALQEGIVIADQLPTVMAQEVLKNTGLKIGLKITSADDRSLLGSTMAASPMQLEQMSTFAVGEALVFYEKLMRPFTMKIKKWWGDLDDEDKEKELTTPQRDEKLRETLSTTRTYVFENETSVEIILKKYKARLSDLDGQISDAERAFTAIAQALSRLNKHYDLLCNAALGNITLSEEILTEKYNEFESAKSSLIDWFNESKEKIRKPLEIATVLYGWMSSIDRLSKGRWKRFNLDPQHSMAVKKMQTELKKIINRLSSHYTEVAVQVNAMGTAGDADLRSDLVASVNKSGLTKAANEMLELLQKSTII